MLSLKHLAWASKKTKSHSVTFLGDNEITSSTNGFSLWLHHYVIFFVIMSKPLTDHFIEFTVFNACKML